MVASLANTIVVFILAARALGPASFGEFAFYFAIASGFGLVFDFGYPISLLRNRLSFLPQGRLRIPLSSFYVKSAMFIVLTPLAVFALALAGAEYLLAIVFWAGIALRSVSNFLAASLRSLGLHKVDAWNNLVSSAIGTGAAVAALLVAPTKMGFAVALLVGSAFVLMLTWLAWRRKCRFVRVRMTRARLGSELRENFVFFLDAVCRRSFGLLDVAILGIFASPVVVGLYQSAQKIVQGVNIFAQPFSNVLMPLLSKHSRTPDSFARNSRLAIIGQTLFGVVSGCLVALVGPYVVPLVFSQEFAEAGSLFPFFGILIVIRFAFSAVSISRVAQGFILERLISNAMVLFFFAVLGSAGAYWYGARGVIVALTAATLIGLFYLSFLIRNRSAGLGPE
ncbi:lipopolysaccharide biosynthesis protein [Erythrobacteraceae bacterium WH01K]|nr:lipopolysaccharide biosynthesis protein [Erythrobacteraceae bacterium WH01K]